MFRGWLLAVAAAVAVVAPVAVAAWLQRGQVSWIPRPGWKDAGNLVTTLGGGLAAATVLGLLAVIGVAARERPGAGGPGASAARPVPARPAGRGQPPGRDVAWLAGPWLVLPPLLLLALSEARPVYNGRYVTCCLPAVALLAGTGLAALRWPGRAAALALLAACCLPLQLAIRTPGEPHPGRRELPGPPRAARRRHHLPGGVRPAVVPGLPGRLQPAAATSAWRRRRPPPGSCTAPPSPGPC